MCVYMHVCVYLIYHNRTDILVTIPTTVMLCPLQQFLLYFSMVALELQASCVCMCTYVCV